MRGWREVEGVDAGRREGVDAERRQARRVTWWRSAAGLVLPLVLASCGVDAGPSAQQQPLTLAEAQRISVENAFTDAAVYCEARLLGTRTLTPSRARELGDLSLARFAGLEGRRLRIQGGPHAGSLPQRDRLAAQNACSASVSLALGAEGLDARLTDGFCRADFNYCVAQELLLRAAAPGTSTDLATTAMRHRARERFAAAALEYVTDLAWYARHCDNEPDAAHASECVRLAASPAGSPGYAATAEARLADAVSRMASSARAESANWLAEAESVAANVDSFDPNRVVERVWGPEGGRTRAAEVAFGPAGDTTWDATPNARRSADVPLPIALSADERATLALSLLSRYDVPLDLVGFDLPFGPPRPAFVMATWTSPMLLSAIFNLLDHRIAAEAYEPPYLANPLAPDFAAGEALRHRDELTLAQFLGYETRAISPESSPLAQRFGLTEADVADALRLFADAIEVEGVDYLRKRVVAVGVVAFYSARITDAGGVLPIRTLAGSLADDASSAGPDPLALLMPPLPRDGGGVRVDNWYAPSLSRVDASRTHLPDEDAAAPLGLSGALALLRVHMQRLRSMEASFIDPAPLTEAIDLVDSTLGASWMELDMRTDFGCPNQPPLVYPGPRNLARFVEPIAGGGPLSSGNRDPINLCLTRPELCPSLPLYQPCARCRCTPSRRTQSGNQAFWEVYYPTDPPEGGPDDFATGEAVLVRDAGSAACLIRGHQVEVGGPCPTPQTLLEIASADPSPVLDRRRRRFRLTNLASYARTGRGSRAFILWRSKDGNFRLVDVLHPGRGPAVHALGGTLLDGLEGIWARSAYAPSYAQIKATGLAAGLVPPLESELTSDSDAFEDSFRRYLDEARVAASVASAELSEARRMQALALLEDTSDPIRRQQAALAETEALGELCGSEGQCDPPRLPDRPTLGSLGVVIATDDPGAVEADGRADPPVPLSCEDRLDGLFENWDIPSNNRNRRKAYVTGYLTHAVLCALHRYTSALAESQVVGLPQAVQDELTAGGAGEFTEFHGALRGELIQIFQNLANAHSAERRMFAQRDASLAYIAAAALTVQDMTPSRRERGLCRAQQYLGAARDISDMGVNGSRALRSSPSSGTTAPADSSWTDGRLEPTRSVGNDTASLGGRLESWALTGGCGNLADSDLAGDEALLQLARSLEALRGQAVEVRQLLVSAYLGIARIDELSRKADFARARRGVADRLTATDNLADLPEWRSLAGFNARRARAALARARQAAFVARRAIEFRLVEDLSALHEPEPFVEAPSLWVDALARLGVEAGTVPAAAGGDGGLDPDAGVVFSTDAEAITDYVDRLERFVDGYPFARRFRDATDRQVLDLAALMGLPDGQLIYGDLLYQCFGHDGLLRGGVTPESRLEAGVAEPCAELGGVEHAELSFEWRTRPDGYLAQRIATGSFNYRHRALGVNLDGTAVLDCERAASPAECYADANVPYVLRQSGAVTLESFEGARYSFAMEPGVIRGGRALTAERVLTNPVSGADLVLMTPYLKRELRGRPLAGQYTLTIPGRPEIQWQNLRTIQLLVDYGYWTRQR